jgi:hypothetical protein
MRGSYKLSLSLLFPAVLTTVAACGSSDSAASAGAKASPSPQTSLDAGEGRSAFDGSVAEASTADAASTPDGECIVDSHPVIGASDFYEGPQLALLADGSGALVYASNGASTGALVSGSYWERLGPGAAPSGAPTKRSKQLHHDVAQASAGVVLATATNTSEGVQLVWLDSSGVGTRGDSIANSVNARPPAVAVVGGVTYVAWVLDSFTTGAARDAVWIAGYDATHRVFGPTAIKTTQTSGVTAHLTAVSGTAYLVWDGAVAGSSAVSWATVDAAGNTGVPVTAAASGRVDGFAVRGNTLAYAWTLLKVFSPSVQTGVEVRAANLGTGATVGSLSLAASSTSKEREPALVATGTGFSLALASDDTQAGAVQWLDLSATLGITRRVKVAASVRSSAINIGGAVGIGATADAVYVAHGDANGAVWTTRITCPQ